MGMSKKAWRRLATAVAVPGTALGALAGFAAAPAMAGTVQPQLMPANETFYGYSTVYSEYIPVKASGVISDRGYLALVGGTGPSSSCAMDPSTSASVNGTAPLRWTRGCARVEEHGDLPL